MNQAAEEGRGRHPSGQRRALESASACDYTPALLRTGSAIQFGLTRSELDKVWKRVQKLIERVDSGELPAF